MRMVRAEALILGFFVIAYGCSPPLTVGMDAHLGDGAMTMSDGSGDGRIDGSSSTDVIQMDARIDVAPDVHRVCPWTAAGTIAIGQPVSGTLPATGTSMNSSASCLSAFQIQPDGPEQVYTLTVPTAMGITLTLTNTNMVGTPVMIVRSTCDDPNADIACAFQPTASGITVSQQFAPGTYYIVIDSACQGTCNPIAFTLAATAFTPSQNGTCATPRVLAPGSGFSNQSTMGGSISGPLCQLYQSGPTVYYSAVVPAGMHLGVETTVIPPSAQGDIAAVSILSGCDQYVCAASGIGSGGSPAAPFDVSYDNTTSSPQTVIIAVTGAPNDQTSPVTFNILTSTSAIPFTESVIPVHCDDMSTATALAPNNGNTSFTDDSTSAIFSLPFSIRFFGTQVSYGSISSNGFAQLYVDSTPMPSQANVNSSFPTPLPQNPLGAVAPFWDDLFPVYSDPARTNALATIKMAVFPDTGGIQHITLDWDNWALYSDQNSTLLHFQAKLFSNSAIEFHYCSLGIQMRTDAGVLLTSNAMILGSSATIGLQDVTGVRSEQHSDNTVGAVMNHSALRFVPVN